MTSCLHQFVATESGCAINWFRKSSIPDCSTFEDFKVVQEIWNWLWDASYSDIVDRTGCIQKCSFFKYEIVKQKTEKITWKTNTTRWLSEFYIYTHSDHVVERKVDINPCINTLIISFFEGFNFMIMMAEI